ncbi:hypothetical protein [Tsuneonella troitsensis]|jgi:hypothetical protein|uniref:hypothetical protein n=1 Tax=Tsuneonella troitsensis TaxID=292222 RepID=UPI00070EAD83|nr:hypothetical protein [Tsuneonella troitsensis]
MLHKFFEPGDWFAPKKRGKGSGVPTAWQGWVVIVTYIGVVMGLSRLLVRPSMADYVMWAVGMVLATGLMMVIARNRTPGRWR